MRQFFVIAGNGARYGPADLDTLVRWTREGRIVSGTLLVDTSGDRQFPAGELPEIRSVLFGLNDSAALDETLPAPRPLQPRAYTAPAPGLQSLQTLQAMRQVEVSQKSRLAAGLLGIFLGGIGAHRFYLGYPGIGIIMLLSNVFCGMGIVWGFIEGLICLSGGMRDSDGRILRD